MLITVHVDATDEVGAKSAIMPEVARVEQNVTFGVATEPQLRRISYDER